MSRPFITFANNQSRLFEGKMQKSNIPYKVTTVMHHHIVSYSDHGHFHNMFLSSFKGEHPGPTYYLSPANIYGVDIHDASNNIFSVYNWTEFEGEKGVKNIASCLLRWLNDKGLYSRLYSKKHKIPEIAIIVYNCDG